MLQNHKQYLQIRHHLDLQRQFLQLLEADGRFELTAPPRFGLTCFAVRVRPHMVFERRTLLPVVASISHVVYCTKLV